MPQNKVFEQEAFLAQIQALVKMPTVLRFPPWIYEPASAVPFDEHNFVDIPAIGAVAVILDFTVPPGMNGAIAWRANTFVGGGFVDGSGDVVWQILQNGQPFRNYENIIASLGIIALPPRTGVLRISENDRIQLTVRNVAVVVAGQRSGGRLSGWYYQKNEERDDEIWFT